MSETIHLDFETYSEIDLRSLGINRYCDDKSTRILCYAWCYSYVNAEYNDVHEYHVSDCTEKPAFNWKDKEIHAWNVEFERHVWHEVANWPYVPLKQWFCTAAFAAAAGYPRGLDKCAQFLGIPGKDRRGKLLIQRLSKPCKRPIKPENLKKSLDEMKEYCLQDVRVEQDIYGRACLSLNEEEREVYLLNTKINEAGIPLDTELLRCALDKMTYAKELLMAAVIQITDININSYDQMINYLKEKGYPLPNLQKDTLISALPCIQDPAVKLVVETRLAISKSGNKKLEKMSKAAIRGKIYGTHLYHGAQTGRWSSKIIQTQNMKKTTNSSFIDNLSDCKKVETTEECLRYLNELSDCTRKFIYMPRGFVIGDFHAIELRVLLWYTNSKEALNLVAEGRDIYKEFASLIFNKRVKEITKEERWLGKTAVLGLGFGMGHKYFCETCEKYGQPIPITLAQKCVNLYKSTYPNVSKTWEVLDVRLRNYINANCTVEHPNSTTLGYKLPSGRCMVFNNLAKNSNNQLTYSGYYKGRFTTVSTWGGKFFQNIVQAIARDLLAHSLRVMWDASIPIIMHVHDEIVARDCDPDKFKKLMETQPSWAKGLPLKAEVKWSQRYEK